MLRLGANEAHDYSQPKTRLTGWKETWEMKEYSIKENRSLRVIKLTNSGDRQIVLLATDDRILCYQPETGSQLEPIEPEYLGLALAVNRFK